jgi:hypothetical protein
MTDENIDADLRHVRPSRDLEKGVGVQTLNAVLAPTMVVGGSIMPIRFACAFLCLALAFPASGTLIDMGNAVRDPSTSLDWLKLTETVSASHNDLIAGFGGLFADGWRHATEQEVCGIFIAIGGLPTPCPGSSIELDDAIGFALWEELSAAFGRTYLFDRVTGGLYDYGSTDGSLKSASVRFTISQGGFAQVSVGATNSVSAEIKPGASGHFLVRAIPEPATGALVALGLGTIAVGFRQSR